MNDRIFIEGGHKLKGNVQIQGSKNATLPMMAASLLHRGVSVLKGCPRIADVFCMEEILQNLGAVTWWEDHDLYLDCTKADKTEVPFSFTGRMRSSVILLGALLGRNKKGSLGYPGGCVIGKRPIDMHLLVLESLGARIQEVAGQLSAECERMKGTEFSLFQKEVWEPPSREFWGQCWQREKRFWKTVPASRKSAGFVIIFVPWARRLQGTVPGESASVEWKA